MTTRRTVALFGDGAVLAGAHSVDDAHRLAAAVIDARWRGVEDVVVGFETVTVIIDPTAVDAAALAEDLAGLDVASRPRAQGRHIEIPVVFDGADLEDVAHFGHLTVDNVVELLTSTELVVAFMGFAPGFAYLVGLPPVLADVPRRRTPRASVPAGSVALAGGFAGIYPQASPGGWHLVGRSGARLFDPEMPPFSLLLPGDHVRLVPGGSALQPADAAPRPKLESTSPRRVVVQSPGMLSLVEDLGRTASAGLGVPRSGGADPFSLRMANRLVGNDDSDAALEVTAAGPTLLFTSPCHIAVVGRTRPTIDGVELSPDCVAPVIAGQVLSVGPVHQGLRAYVAVDGGIDIPPVLGSRSSDVLARIGAGPLVAGDVVGLGTPGRPHGRLHDMGLSEHSPAVLRVMAGPDQSEDGVLATLCDAVWEVQVDSDRVGVRLGGERALPVSSAQATSRGMVTGAIQVPPDGQPIVLLCDHATVGGYPVPATVVSADLGVLGQCRPGDLVRFDLIDHRQAMRARASRERVLSRSIVGWFPVRSD